MDRFDREACLMYFDAIIQMLENETMKQFWKESITRKEARYNEIKKQEPLSLIFLEERDYMPRRVDSIKIKKLKSLEARARQGLKESKEAAAVALREYNAELAVCDDCDLDDSKRLYASHLTTAISSGITALLAAVQRSSYITEDDVNRLSSKLNQKLAEARALRAKFSTRLTEKDVADFKSLLTETQNINTEIALLNTHGLLYSISRRLATIHLKWERKAVHATIVMPNSANDFSYHLGLFADSLDKAATELSNAHVLVIVFNPLNTKKVLGQLFRAHQQLQATANEQKAMMQLLQTKEVALATPYDLIEEVLDNRIHGLSEPKESTIPEEIITVRLYPEKGEAVITISGKRKVFSTLDEEELVSLIAAEVKLDKEKIKQQLRFEIGGK